MKSDLQTMQTARRGSSLAGRFEHHRKRRDTAHITDLLPLVAVGVETGFGEVLGEARVGAPPAPDPDTLAVVQRRLGRRE